MRAGGLAANLERGMGQRLSEADENLYRVVDEVLHYLWDPIGVAGIPAARDEYQGYLPEVFRLVRSGSDASAIAATLGRIGKTHMGLPARPAHDEKIAQILVAWKADIEVRHGS